MKYKIKNRFTNKVIFEMEAECFKQVIEEAIKQNKNLRFANLSSANLSSADLSSAKINKFFTTPLYGMLDQIGKIRAYKIINKDSEGIFQGGIKYEIGKEYEVKDANTNESQQCAEGINLATLDWVCKNWIPPYRILIAEFEVKDIAGIPVGSDGKFRVFKCKIVGEKDLKELGLVEKEV